MLFPPVAATYLDRPDVLGRGTGGTGRGTEGTRVLELTVLVKAGTRTERAGREVQAEQEVTEKSLGVSYCCLCPGLSWTPSNRTEIAAWWLGCSSSEVPPTPCSKGVTSLEETVWGQR